MNEGTVHILLVEDDEDDFLIVRDLLADTEGGPVEITWVANYQDAQDHIRSQRYDIFLLDYALGKNSGLDLVRYAQTIQCETPCILLTGRENRQVDVKAGKTGAVDFLVKGELSASSLERSIRYALERRKAALERERLAEQLLETSRQLGMAEIASNVLHNVGNVLNSINTSVNQISKALDQLYINDLGKIAGMFKEHQQDLGEFLTQDPKGRSIPSYFHTFSNHLLGQHHIMAKEIQTLTRNLDHVKHIIQAQQSLAQSNPHLEPVVLSDLMEQAININLASLLNHQIKVVRHYSDIPTILADKHLILQILVNLIRNAKHAMIEQPGVDHRLELTIDHAQDGKRVLLSVQDSGVGIGPQHLSKIFSQGFTTKQGGLGLGLHCSALSAKALEGSLTAFSEGKGKGARLTLDLPFTPVEALMP